MSDHAVSYRICIAVEHGLSEQEAVRLSRWARAFPFDLHLNVGRRRIDAKSIVEMLDLSHELGEEAVIEIEAEGDGSLEAIESLAEAVQHPVAPVTDELAFFGLVGASGNDPDGYPSIADLDPVDALHVLSLASGPLHPERSHGSGGMPLLL